MSTPSRSSGSPRPHGRRSAAGGDTTDLREAILAATAGLLADRPFGDLAVGDILIAAGVPRGSFYFYFDSKNHVLAALLRRAAARRPASALAGTPWPPPTPRPSPPKPPSPPPSSTSGPRPSPRPRPRRSEPRGR